MHKITCPACSHTFEYQTKDENEYFAEWWKIYPRREAKGQARKAYNRALLKIGPDILLSRARLYADACKHREREFIRLPATWLNGESWLDEGLGETLPRSETPSTTPAIPASWTLYHKALANMIGEDKFLVWFGDTTLEIKMGHAVIYASSPFKQDWIRTHFSNQLYRLLGDFEVRVLPLPLTTPPPD